LLLGVRIRADAEGAASEVSVLTGIVGKVSLFSHAMHVLPLQV
jgi:hypothetical protein